MKDIKINYDQTYTSKYGRDYYRGQSFHYAGKWTVGTRYVSDSYNTDFVSYKNWLLVCKKSHTASSVNEPLDIIYDSDDSYNYGLSSPYWDIVIPTDNRMAEIAEALTRDYMHKISISAEELRIAYTELIRNTRNEITEEYTSIISQTAREISSTVEHNKQLTDDGFEQMLSRIVQTAEEINSRVDHEVSTLNGTIDHNHSEISQRADAIVSTVEQYKIELDDTIESNRSEINQRADSIMSTVEQYKTELDDTIEENKSQINQRADSIVSMVNQYKEELNGTIEQNHSEINQRADSIVSTVENYKEELDNTIETNRSEINQRADNIVSTVEQYKTELEGTIAQNRSEINQKADSIVSTVESYKEELDGAIETNRSEINQRANSIEQTVASNKIDADSKITNLDSKITQTASEIRSEVNEAVTELNGAIETNNSSIVQRANEIEATVTANKQAAENALNAVNEELSSRITQNAEAISTEVSDRLTSEGEIIADYDSKFEQTAQSISTEVSAREAAIEGVQTDYNSKFQQTAQDIQTEVSARETSEAGIVNDYNSKITQTASEINATVTANKQATDDAINALDEELSSKITQNAEAITAEVNARTSSEGEIIEDYTSKIQQTADAITSEVTARKASESELVEDYESKISQTATEIRTEVTENIETMDGRLTTAESNITQNANSISAQVSRLNNFETSVGNTFTTHQELLNSLQTQVDGAIETYFAEGLPTLQNYPADDWDTDEIKEIHVGDIYYDKNTGYSYRFLKENGNYIWFRILDSDITTAIANAAAAQKTANGKMTIYYKIPPETPTTYNIGDLWIYEDGNELIVKKSTQKRTDNYVSTDWVLVSDVANITKIAASFEIFADMLRSEVGEYEYTGGNNLVPNSLYSYIVQTKDNISLKIGTAKGEAITASDSNTDGKLNTLNDNLLDTGIDITDKKIELTADNIILKNNSGERGLELITGSDGKPLIDVTNLNVSGIFTTEDWNTTSSDLLSTAQGYASDAETNAKDYAKSTNYLTDYVIPKVNDGTTALKESLEGEGGSIKAAKDAADAAQAAANDLAYLKNALTEENTTIAGGLVLSTLIQLGSGAKTSNWQVYSGLNGSYQNGNSIAFWAGGEMSETGSRPAKAVIRMDGSGYLANKNISWDNTGNASFTGNITANSISFGDNVTIDAQYIIGLSTQDITGLDSLSYVKSITAGTGLNGGTITSSGTISLAQATTTAIGGIKANTQTASDVYVGETIWSNTVTLGNYFVNLETPTGKGYVSIPNSFPASDVYSWAKASVKPSYSYDEITDTPGVATTEANGLMSKTDKTYLNNILYNTCSFQGEKVFNDGVTIRKTNATYPLTIEYTGTSLYPDGYVIPVGITFNTVRGLLLGRLKIEEVDGSFYRVNSQNSKYKIYDSENLTTLSQLTNDCGFITSAISPGTLKTDETTAQTPSASEAMSGNIKLHKISKTGSYDDLLDKPTIPTNTWRTIYCGTEDIGNNRLTLKAGANVTLSNSNGTITISATDTNTWPTVASNNNTASWGNQVVVGTVGGTELKFTMPVNPNTDTNTTYSISKSDGSTANTTKLMLTPSSGTPQSVEIDTISVDTLTANYAKITDLEAGRIWTSVVDVRTTTSDENTRIAYIGNTDYPIYAGGNPCDEEHAVFKVAADGTMYSTAAHITGEINAESGTIIGRLTIGSTGDIYSVLNYTDRHGTSRTGWASFSNSGVECVQQNSGVAYSTVLLTGDSLLIRNESSRDNTTISDAHVSIYRSGKTYTPVWAEASRMDLKVMSSSDYSGITPDGSTLYFIF